MVHHGDVPDPCSTGELHLLGEFRHVIDSIFLRKDADMGHGYFQTGGLMETTWGTTMFRYADSFAS